MNDRAYVRIRPELSWHVVIPILAINGYQTLCGRTVDRPALSVLPGDEKTCERCAVLAVRADDRPEDDGSTQPVETLP